MSTWKIIDGAGAPIDAVKIKPLGGSDVSAYTDAQGMAQLSADCALVVVQKEGCFDMLLPTQGGVHVMQPALAWEDEVINDETLDHRIVYSDGWQYYNAYPGDQALEDVRKNQVMYNTDAHGTKLENETATLQFHGTTLRIFGLADSYGGQASVTIDDGVASEVSFYRPRLAVPQATGERLASFADNATDKNTNNSKAYHLLYEVYDLADTDHTAVLRTGAAPNGSAQVCRAVLDFVDVSTRPVFHRFNFAPYFVSDITQNSVLATQCIAARGASALTQLGFVCSATGVPTVADIMVEAPLCQEGEFSTTIAGLSPYTQYAIRPFAVAQGVVYYGHEMSRFRTKGSVILSHELYGGFEGEEFTLTSIDPTAQLDWVCETVVHKTHDAPLAPEEILSISPVTGGVEISLVAQGNVLVKALDPDTGALCAACDVTVACREKATRAQTPPMGWNSWNCFLRKINVENISQTLEAMAMPITKDGKSLKDLGYDTCVIDGGWRENFLDETGAMVPSVLLGGKEGFPQLLQKAKAMGLKTGLHISPGDRDCMSQPIGAKWNEAIHYEQFRNWGLSFLKIDQCDYRPYLLNDMQEYARWMYVRHKFFLDNSGCEAVYSISNYHFDGWQHEVGNMWRISGDIATQENTTIPFGARWNTPGPFCSVYECANEANAVADFAGPGAWNDAEMCVVGDKGLSDIEGASQFNLWCMMSAPLILGNDLRDMSEKTIEIITNEEVIAIDQDALGVQGRRIWKKTMQGELVKQDLAPALELWAKPLEDGSFAVLLLNNTNDAPADITVAFSSLGFLNEITGEEYAIEGQSFLLRDLNAHTSLGQFETDYTTRPLLPHESVMLKITSVL